MICKSCVEGNPKSECLGLTRDKTWCDSQHVERSGGIDPLQCQHLTLTEPTRVCPSCSRSVPLTMTKYQAKALLMDFLEDVRKTEEREDFHVVLDGYAERILNDRPTRTQASLSEL